MHGHASRTGHRAGAPPRGETRLSGGDGEGAERATREGLGRRGPATHSHAAPNPRSLESRLYANPA